jgi:hypothetical protein
MGAKRSKGLWLAIAIVGAVLATAAFAPSFIQAAASLLQQGLLPGGASPGLILVLGGLVVMTAVALVALFSTTLEPAPVEPARIRSVHTRLRTDGWSEDTDAYRGPKDVEYARGRATGDRVEAETMDDVFDQMVVAQLGEPRIVRALPTLLRVRLHACRGCGRPGDAAHGCAFETGFLEGALSRALKRSAVAHEVRCRGSGAPACEFEVWY